MRFVRTLQDVMAGAVLLALSLSQVCAQEIDMALAGRSLSSSIPLMVNDLGLFEKHGVKPKFVTLETADATVTALLSGSVQFAHSGVAPLIAARARGQNLVAINSSYKGLAGSLVLSKPVADRLGVSPQAPVAERLKALNGVLIASSSPTSSYTLSYRSGAEAHGAKPSFTYMQFTAMQAAMNAGAIQGFVAAAPFWLLPVMEGSGVLWVSGPKGELPAVYRPAHTSVMLVKLDYARANPDLIRRVNAAFADFVTAIDTRPQDIKTAMKKYLVNLDDRTIAMLFETESLGWRTKPITRAELEHEISYVKATVPSLQAALDSIDPSSLVFQ